MFKSPVWLLQQQQQQQQLEHSLSNANGTDCSS